MIYYWHIKIGYMYENMSFSSNRLWFIQARRDKDIICILYSESFQLLSHLVVDVFVESIL